MFSISSSNKKSKEPPLKALVNIATIASAVITSLRLAFWGVISAKTAFFIMIGVVVFVALGNNLSKIVLAIIAVVLFSLLGAAGNPQKFQTLLMLILTLIIPASWALVCRFR